MLIFEKNYKGHGLIETTDGEVRFLTNGCAESTGHWSVEDFEELDLAYCYHRDDRAYPLTFKEQAYLFSEQHIEGTHLFALGNYSALWRNQKWFAPVIEFPYGNEYPAPALAQVFLFTRALEFELDHALWQAFREAVLFVQSEPARFTLHVLLPCQRVLAIDSVFTYQDALFLYLKEAAACVKGIEV